MDNQSSASERNYQKSSNNKSILPIILGLLLVGALVWAFFMMNGKSKLAKEKASLTTEMTKLSSVKEQLAAEVDSLSNAYSTLSNENTSLQENYDEAEAKLKSRNARIAKLKKQLAESKTSNQSLSDQIQGLLATKNSLEASIANLRSENDSLKQVSTELAGNLSKVQSEKEALARLNESINKEVGRLTLANFKATAFNVGTELKKGKVHTKSRRIKRVKASFDLNHVPEKYQGVRPVYLVITDEKATPISLEKPINASVTVNGQQMDIQAAEAKEINIVENQRLSFSHDLTSKLPKGFYRVSVYTDIGLLGASSFRLR